MSIDSKYKEILEIVKRETFSSAHRLDHIIRVHNLCMLISKYEKDVDLDVLAPAALLHDIAKEKEGRAKTGEFDHAVLGGEMAEKILNDFGYSKERTEKIKHCIVTHRFRTGNEPGTIEAKILFDADKLDVIGSIGIARSFMIAGQFGQSISKIESLDGYLAENTAENGRLKDVSKHSPYIEYEVKFKKIPDRLYTKKAKEIAINRLKFMEDFFKRLTLEIDGIE